MKLTSLFVAMFIVGIATVHAQQTTDSTSVNQSTIQQPQSDVQSGNQYAPKDYQVMESSDVPASLRSTLQGSRYKGWEEGKVYKSTSSNGYWLNMGTGTESKNFYFDRNGKATSAPGTGPSPE
jgi:hypothetical protein